MSNDDQQHVAPEVTSPEQAPAAPAAQDKEDDNDDDARRSQQSSPDGDAAAAVSSSSASSSSPQNGFRRTDPSEVVTPKEAVAALNEALSLLKKASDPNMPWQDARRVLDVTGDALDVAGLALKAAEDEGDDNNARNDIHDDDGDGDDSEDDGGLGEVQWLSVMVSAARSRLLGDAYVDAKRRDPPPLPPGGTNDTPLLVWASQTGTAESFASSLAGALRKGGASSKKKKIDVVDMTDAKLEDVVVRKRAYFVVSTFGIGRPPRKAEAFYASLQLYRGGAGAQSDGGGKEDSSGKDGGGGGGGNGNDDFRPLAGTEVAVAALGDSRFRDFAAFGINLAQELQALGARPVIKVTTLDGKDGPDAQEAEYRNWEDLIARIERARSGETTVVTAGGGQATGGGGVPSTTRREGEAGGSCCVVS